MRGVRLAGRAETDVALAAVQGLEEGGGRKGHGKDLLNVHVSEEWSRTAAEARPARPGDGAASGRDFPDTAQVVSFGSGRISPRHRTPRARRDPTDAA
ncbi:hypothetical protein GCM10019017_72460 [Streptomyces showdoensis]